MAVPSRKCPSCGNDVSLLAHACPCGYTFEEPRSSSSAGKDIALHRVILTVCRGLCLVAAVLTIGYLVEAVKSRNYLTIIGAPIAMVLLLGVSYIFKAVQIFLDGEE